MPTTNTRLLGSFRHWPRSAADNGGPARTVTTAAATNGKRHHVCVCFIIGQVLQAGSGGGRSAARRSRTDGQSPLCGHASPVNFHDVLLRNISQRASFPRRQASSPTSTLRPSPARQWQPGPATAPVESPATATASPAIMRSVTVCMLAHPPGAPAPQSSCRSTAWGPRPRLSG